MKRILTVLALLGAASAAQASVVVLSNLSAGGSVDGLDLSTISWVAVGLRTAGPGDAFGSMAVYVSNPNPGDLTLKGGIYSDFFGSPGTLLSSFSSQNVAANTPSTIFTLTAESPVVFSAAEDYWFVLTDDPAGLLWNTDGVDYGTAPTAEAGYSWLGYLQSGSAGSSWGSTPYMPAVQITFTDASAVPEPGTVAMLAGGLLAFACVRRARRACSRGAVVGGREFAPAAILSQLPPRRTIR